MSHRMFETFVRSVAANLAKRGRFPASNDTAGLLPPAARAADPRRGPDRVRRRADADAFGVIEIAALAYAGGVR